ncbi:programmed cell death protein 7-like [Nothobranchius furzeri]|uniref:Programmed cell death 7 n=2 Tax=Nothobranchius furzeri TaxID=105023 RepID=A0A1A8AVH4_NOTFU|nr:programmed cell death protein 7 [Nothobranchius furzeri]KAF7212913.1 programmed cell death protein 7-like [Nothobranchius furzeri]
MDRSHLHSAAGPPGSSHPDRTGSSWTPPAAYGVRGDFPQHLPRGAAFGGPGVPVRPPFGFGPTASPPPLGFPGPAPAYGGVSVFRPPQHGPHCGPRQPCPPSGTEDQEARQKRQDQQWLARFLQSRAQTTGEPETQQRLSVRGPVLRDTLCGAARLVSRLEELRLRADPESGLLASRVKEELLRRLGELQGSEGLVATVAQSRARRRRARARLQLEKKLSEEHRAEKEAAIDAWRMRQVQQVEEKKKEQELKRAADSVLCEVRKKQADVKRMQDVLRSLEKLRRLRKEAASRKGIATEQQTDEVFSSSLEQLRSVMKRRTSLYSAEEKALMVMLEGEQEEERRREQEKRVKKERERQLERRSRVDSILFGDGRPADLVLQPFTDYYRQAERSLQALIHIRREWDAFLVAADHPDGSTVPQSWILPDPPSDHVWASALQAADAD